MIQSYLRERYEEVLIDKINAYCSVSSRQKQVTNAVPQGSILGPILFLVYSNDSPKIIDHGAKVVPFADTSIWELTLIKRDFK